MFTCAASHDLSGGHSGADRISRNFFLPLMIGAKDVAFPFQNLLSWWLFIVGALLAIASLLRAGFLTRADVLVPYPSARHRTPPWRCSVCSSWASADPVRAELRDHGAPMRAPEWDSSDAAVRVVAHAKSWVQVLATPILGITCCWSFWRGSSGSGNSTRESGTGALSASVLDLLSPGGVPL